MSSDNGSCERILFDNVLAILHPNGDGNWQAAYNGFNRIELRETIMGRLRTIEQKEVHLEKCKDCIVKRYNPGIIPYSCFDPFECPAVYAPISDHKKMGFKPGKKAE